MATTFRSKSNYPLGQGTLNTAIDDNDLSIVLDAGQGASFPASNFTISIDEEIILIDSRSTDTLTVNASGRGYDSSTASAHAAGVAINNYQIVKDFTDCETAINGIENGTTTLAKVVTSGTAANTHTIDDAATNTVVSVLELYKTSSGTPAAGIGAKLLLGAEDSAGNKEAAIEFHGILTTVTNGAEVGSALIRVKQAGSFVDGFGVHGAGYNSGVLGLACKISGATNPGLLIDASSGSSTAAKLILNIAADSSYGKVQWRVADTKYFEWAMQGTALTSLKLFYSDSDTLCATFGSTGGLDLVGAATATGFTATNTGIATGFIAKRSDNTGNARTGAFLSQGVNSTPAYVTYAAFYGASNTLTAGAEDGSALIYTMKAGTLTKAWEVDKNGDVTQVGHLNIPAGKNIAVATSTGTKIGTSASQLLGFWNATPTTQPASANQAALTLDVDVTGGDTVDKAAIDANFSAIQTLLNQLRSDLVTAGLIKGSA